MHRSLGPTASDLVRAARSVAAAAVGGPDSALGFRLADAALMGVRPASDAGQEDDLLAWVTPPAFSLDWDDLVSTSHARLCKALAVTRNRANYRGAVRPSLAALNRGAELIAHAAERRAYPSERVAFDAHRLRPLGRQDLLARPLPEVLWVSVTDLPSDWEGAVTAAIGRILVTRALWLRGARRNADGAPLSDAA
jgi:hypothetical protein